MNVWWKMELVLKKIKKLGVHTKDILKMNTFNTNKSKTISLFFAFLLICHISSSGNESFPK